MARFLAGHGADPDWRVALARADAMLREQAGDELPTLGWCYVGDAYAPHAQALLEALHGRWPGVAWVGCAGYGTASGEAEHLDTPALSLMLSALPREQFRIFHGGQPLPAGFAHAALVHADPDQTELPGLVAELAQRVGGGGLVGGLSWSRTGAAQFADGVWRGGLTGVGFASGVALTTRITQGCQPIGPVREVTAAAGNLVIALDGRPALPQLLQDLGLEDLSQPRQALPRLRATLVGLSDAEQPLLDRGGQFGSQARVRPLVGVDPVREAVAIGDEVQPGQHLGFGQRDAERARRDLVRVCTEIREELAGPADGRASPRTIDGAVYVSCASRGGPFFGGPAAELKLVQHALGDVPLAGFFAAGEIAGTQVHGHSGVLAVFTSPP